MKNWVNMNNGNQISIILHLLRWFNLRSVSTLPVSLFKFDPLGNDFFPPEKKKQFQLFHEMWARKFRWVFRKMKFTCWWKKECCVGEWQHGFGADLLVVNGVWVKEKFTAGGGEAYCKIAQSLTENRSLIFRNNSQCSVFNPLLLYLNKIPKSWQITQLVLQTLDYSALMEYAFVPCSLCLVLSNWMKKDRRGNIYQQIIPFNYAQEYLIRHTFILHFFFSFVFSHYRNFYWPLSCLLAYLATARNARSTFNPVFAEVSINTTLYSRDNRSPSSRRTIRSGQSALLPSCNRGKKYRNIQNYTKMLISSMKQDVYSFRSFDLICIMTIKTRYWIEYLWVITHWIIERYNFPTSC